MVKRSCLIPMRSSFVVTIPCKQKCVAIQDLPATILAAHAMLVVQRHSRDQRLAITHFSWYDLKSTYIYYKELTPFFYLSISLVSCKPLRTLQRKSMNKLKLQKYQGQQTKLKVQLQPQGCVIRLQVQLWICLLKWGKNYENMEQTHLT